MTLIQLSLILVIQNLGVILQATPNLHTFQKSVHITAFKATASHNLVLIYMKPNQIKIIIYTVQC
jgi:hypothetical protein